MIFFFFKAIKFTESAAFCRVGRVTGNNNKFLLGLRHWKVNQNSSSTLELSLLNSGHWFENRLPTWLPIHKFTIALAYFGFLQLLLHGPHYDTLIIMKQIFGLDSFWSKKKIVFLVDQLHVFVRWHCIPWETLLNSCWLFYPHGHKGYNNHIQQLKFYATRL